MKILTIIRDDYFNPVVYGLVEIPDEVQTIKYNAKYMALRNQIKKQQYMPRTRQK